MADPRKEAEEKIGTIRSSVDFNVVGDNILDIAEFTVEKYEFRNDTTLPAETREQALTEIREVLWQRVERLRARRQQILADMFNAAEVTLNEIVEKAE